MDRADHGVAQGVADDDLAARHALEGGGADVGALHDLDHGGADHADEVAEVEQDDGGDGEDELLGDAPASGRVEGGGAGEPAEADDEDAGEEHAHGEFGGWRR